MSNLGSNYDRAQADHDAKEPPSDWNCKEMGHKWRLRRYAHVNGEWVAEYKCVKCRQTTTDAD